MFSKNFKLNNIEKTCSIYVKPVEVKEVIQPGKLNSFLDYQAPEDRYEVRGIMPKAPEYPEREDPKTGRKHSFLGCLD